MLRSLYPYLIVSITSDRSVSYFHKSLKKRPFSLSLFPSRFLRFVWLFFFFFFRFVCSITDSHNRFRSILNVARQRSHFDPISNRISCRYNKLVYLELNLPIPISTFDDDFFPSLLHWTRRISCALDENGRSRKIKIPMKKQFLFLLSRGKL